VLLALMVIGVFAFADDAAAPAPAPIGTFTSWNTSTVALYQSLGGGSGYTSWMPAWDSVPGIDQEWEFAYHGKNYQFYADLEFGMDDFGNFSTVPSNTAIAADQAAIKADAANPTKLAADQKQLAADEASAANVQGATISRFSTTYDFVPGMLAVEIGKPRSGRAPGGFADGGSLGQFYLNSQFGADIQLLPIQGFSATVFTLIPEGTVATNYSNSLSFVADYNMPNMFDVNALYSTINKEFTGGVTITAVKPATIVYAWDLNTNSGTVFQTWASVGGTFVPSLYLALDLDYWYNSNASTTSSIGTEAKAEYTLTPMYAIGVRVGYSDGNGNGLWGTNLGDILNEGGVLVYPYVKANFDNGSYVSLGVSYESGAGLAANQSALQIPLSYVWSF